MIWLETSKNDCKSSFRTSANKKLGTLLSTQRSFIYFQIVSRMQYSTKKRVVHTDSTKRGPNTRQNKNKKYTLKEDTTSVHKLKANNKVLKGQKIANQTMEKEREQKALRFASRPGPNPIKHLHFRVGYN